MIIDTVLNGARYAALSPNFATAFRFLKETDLAALEPGKIAIDGKGKLTVKKGKYKKGTYIVKVKITAKGNSNYKPKTISKTVNIKIK